GKFKFTQCTTPAQGTLTGTVTACDTGAPIDQAMVKVTGGPSDGFSTATLANGTYSMKLAPGMYSVVVSSVPHGCTPSTPQMVTISDGATSTANACLSGPANTSFVSSSISGGNGNGIIERDECNDLSVTIKSTGCSSTSNTTAVLSSSTPGVVI